MMLFALILSDVEFNFQHNNIVDKLKNEEHQVRSNKQEQRCHCVRKRDFSSAFTSKYFLQIFLLKYLKHMSKDTEFFGQCLDTFQISAKLLLKHLSYFLIFDRRSSTTE